MGFEKENNRNSGDINRRFFLFKQYNDLTIWISRNDGKLRDGKNQYTSVAYTS